MFFILFLTSFLATGFVAASSSPTLPKCVRPQDFANGKFVASYEACLDRQLKFCAAHKEVKACDTLTTSGRPYFKVTTDDIDPSKRCKVEHGGSYDCLQDPIRFVTASSDQNAPAQAPSGSPGASATPAFKMPDEEDGGAQPESTPLVAPPMRPPKKN